MRQELSQSVAESHNKISESDNIPRSVGATRSEMVFTLPGQNVMPSAGPVPEGSQPQGLPPQSIHHPRLSLQYFEPTEGFLEVM